MKGERKSAADLSGPRRRCISIESATLSRCSFRHAANPWLTNKDGKQEAKEDDDERQVERHGPVGLLSCRGGLLDTYAGFDRVQGGYARAGDLSSGGRHHPCHPERHPCHPERHPCHPERSEGSCRPVPEAREQDPSLRSG